MLVNAKEQLLNIFDIPYGCILPLKIDNLYVAGRIISMDHEAASLVEPREENTCMITGDVAGVAAAMCVKAKVKPRDLNVKELQKTLTERGYDLRPEVPQHPL